MTQPREAGASEVLGEWTGASAANPFPALARLELLLAQREEVRAGGLWGASQAFVLAALRTREQRPWLIVASTEADADSIGADLRTLGVVHERFPSRAKSARGSGAPAGDLDAARARLNAAQAQTGPSEHRPRIFVASVLALLQPLPTLAELERDFLHLAVGQMFDAEALLRRLVKAGYVRTPLAERAGEVSLRGDILDVFPFANELPLRIELIDDEIESLRSFEPTDQRSVESFARVDVCLAADHAEGDPTDGTLFPSLLGTDTLWIEIEPLRVEESAESLRIQLPAHERALRAVFAARAAWRRLFVQSLPAEDVGFDTRSVQGLEVGLKRAGDALRTVAATGARIVVLCETSAEAQRLHALLQESGGVPGLVTTTGSLSRGFQIPALDLIAVNERELKGIAGTRRALTAGARHRSKAIQSFFELKPGDHVVHAVHGLAHFVGLERLTRGGGEEEHLHLRFAGDVSLFVPASRIDLVQRYIGSGSALVPLDKIGSASFRRRKERVQRGLYDLAAELIEIQAKRALRERPPWRADPALVDEMIGTFPYEDTPDQARVDREIAEDLQNPRPMDRIVCGDVGFGKTELAVRAAFRVVAAGGQVAMLVPTTVLAHQHYLTFRDRFAAFPVEVAVVSRHVPDAATREVLERAEEGTVDLLIGTHRLLSKDVRFKRLGLVVIDEEQRFGVQHKEHFKKLRAQIDVLTLTATPIPRTLHMSLSGIRDIAALTIPPPGRQEIETSLGWKEDDGEIRAAILREKQRGGQVFFLHNRVASIEERARYLRRLVPECSFAVGHGQMGPRELEAVMDEFAEGVVDVLVATTIIENGIDIPTAGTILVDDADRFGLSELHQLRGRVGRGAHKAFCQLLIERHKPIRDVARMRLKALEEMNRLGAGFDISVKDLELRGAGNILGAEQSGHIAAVGYDMYCRLLKLTIDRARTGGDFEEGFDHAEEATGGAELELALRAFLPSDWIPAQDVRIEVLRELAQIHTDEDVARMEAMLRDRFGRIPEEARRLLRVLRVKAELDAAQIRRITWLDGFYAIEYADPVALERLFSGSGAELRRVKSRVLHLLLPDRACTAEQAFAWLEAHLKRNAPFSTIHSYEEA